MPRSRPTTAHSPPAAPPLPPPSTCSSRLALVCGLSMVRLSRATRTTPGCEASAAFSRSSLCRTGSSANSDAEHRAYEQGGVGGVGGHTLQCCAVLVLCSQRENFNGLQRCGVMMTACVSSFVCWAAGRGQRGGEHVVAGSLCAQHGITGCRVRHTGPSEVPAAHHP
jgi:hypothetical protein